MSIHVRKLPTYRVGRPPCLTSKRLVDDTNWSHICTKPRRAPAKAGHPNSKDLHAEDTKLTRAASFRAHSIPEKEASVDAHWGTRIARLGCR